MPGPSFPSPAPCRLARRLLIMAAATSLLIVLIIGGHLAAGRFRPEKDPSAEWMRVFALSGPALWNAGSPARHPETVHPGIPLRPMAGLEGTP
ncbi:hypothetical protein DSCO28_33990 [Desulfosarcina ovata subsp. sediminis]|uniref:Uncharacterized protein n=1 Tax=Desulfosarcina ovata subsp. sediminis TaxID=885957 RepID=A0A5K7ZRU4_9BACT|nr:hypothetical protein [Desulfosarcina ovata]BBO82833.1 hypothetical protein DSCO28_33990 [Desulfosarcina ovata subsp. sediminis]